MRAAVLLFFVSIAAVAMMAPLALDAAEQQPSSAGRSTFRAGVDVVQLDVTVLDKTRQPVRGLTAADFTVLEDDVPRPVVGLEPVILPAPDASRAAWTRDVAPDVVSNQQSVGNIFTIVLDDATTGTANGMWDPWVGQTGRRIARDVIDGLGPADVAAVTFTFMGSKQNFTPDHDKLRAALDTFAPKNSPSAGTPLGCSYRGRGACVLDTIEHIADALPLTPPRRKYIVLISAGAFAISELDFDAIEQRTSHGAALTDLERVFTKLQQKNITVYSFSPHGLQISPGAADDRLRMFAERTGGRTVVNTNAPWERVPAMFEETRSYYLVAFESAHADGRAHRVGVRVARPGVNVIARTSYVAPGVPIEKARGPSKPTAPVLAAMASGFPASQVPIETSAAVFHVPGRSEATLLVLTHLHAPDIAAERVPMRYRASVFDKDWRDRGGEERQIPFGPDAAATSAVLSLSLQVKPGRYELRVAAEAGGRTGSLFTDVEVPDVRRDDLVVSGLLAGPVRAPAPFKDVPGVPVAPVVSRTFGRTESAAAFLRVYQRTAKAEAVTVHVSIADERGREAATESATLDAAAFSPAGSADFVYRLPTDRLGSGEYLLTITFARGTSVVRRTMTFRIEPEAVRPEP